jgi:hypothetical protein
MAKKNEAAPVVETVKSNELVPLEQGDLTSVPSYMRSGTSLGTEEITREDITIPRIALAQSLTPQTKKAKSEYIEGLEEGMLFNTVTNEIYGDELDAVPLFFFKSRIKFGDKIGDPIQCQSLNGRDGGKLAPLCDRCQFSAWGNDGSTPGCTNFCNYMLLLRGGQLGVLSLKSTGIKVAKQFNARVRISNLDMFSKLVKITTISQTKQGNTYYQYVITPTRFTPESTYLKAKDLYTELKKQSIHVDIQGMAEDVGADASDAPVPF